MTQTGTFDDILEELVEKAGKPTRLHRTTM